eukprot:TRINITY_DN1762_c0_g1_i1.p1 TRINITY_DN1762_c0_g1~~TRINITY_DN1762_c0_g1_i1.p1  ORF type:complete len:801 (+),score=323.09 TRINITY_DN1762_c0_g1_i1:173-2575(+)
MAQQNPKKLLADEWEKLEKPLDDILNFKSLQKKITPQEWSASYTTFFNLCTALSSHESNDSNEAITGELYLNLHELLKKHVLKLSKKLESKSGDDLFWSYLDVYKDYSFASGTVAKICAYLERFWIPHHEGQNFKGVQIRKLVLLTQVNWRDFCYASLRQHLQGTLTTVIDRCRRGEAVDIALLKLMIASFEKFGVDDPHFYKREFEDVFIESTKQFYALESVELLQQGISTFLEKAAQRIEQEENEKLGVFYLPPSLARVRDVLNEVLIQKNMETLKTSFEGLLAADKQNELRRMHFLLSRLPDGVQSIANTMEQYIISTKGKELFEPQLKLDAKNAIGASSKFVKGVIDVHKYYSTLILECFSSNPAFIAAMDKAFTVLLNKQSTEKGNTLPRTFSFFVDALMKKRLKELQFTDEEMKDVVDRVVSLSCYFTDADEFIEHMRRAFFKRLLSPEREFESDLETALLNKLKAKKGEAYIRKLQGMYLDSKGANADALRTAFENWNKGDTVGKVKFSALALNESFWPLSKNDRFPLPGQPMEYRGLLERFEEFYAAHTQKGKLIKWIFNQGRVELEVKIPIKKSHKQFTAVVSPLQSCILLLFNRKPTWTFDELLVTLWPDALDRKKNVEKKGDSVFALEEEFLLASAIEPLAGYLKTSPGALIQVGDTPIEEEEGKETPKTPITPSESFTVLQLLPKCKVDKKRKALFPYYSLNLVMRENTTIDTQLIHERGFLIDCAMVKIMKTNRKMQWQKLQVAVVNEVRSFFNPTTQILKRKLEDLIERKFIERDPTDHNTLLYIS